MSYAVLCAGAPSSSGRWNQELVGPLVRGDWGYALVGYPLGLLLAGASYRLGQDLALYVSCRPAAADAAAADTRGASGKFAAWCLAQQHALAGAGLALLLSIFVVEIALAATYRQWTRFDTAPSPLVALLTASIGVVGRWCAAHARLPSSYGAWWHLPHLAGGSLS